MSTFSSATGDSPNSSNECEEDVDPPQLSADTMAALLEFYSEKEAMLVEPPLTAPAFTEIWQLSQFWYDEDTAEILANEAISASQNRIACISCPTLFSKLLQVQTTDHHTVLLEYDRRFEIYREKFIFYDYNDPLNLPEGLQEGSFDLVVVDPPFLSKECLSKVAQTVKFLTKEKVILCTGAVMEEIASELLGVKDSGFIPRHTRNLANPFKCFINYDCLTLRK